MLTAQEVQHIAQLARLQLTPEEEQKYQQQLSSILEYVSQLSQVETASVAPTSQVTGLLNITQADQITEPHNQEDLIKQAPQAADGYVKVKAVFKE
jgi:aspartyl-tRNA(Asn)/glutamyl-tRNA(Gln) amidotransferase subunit C